MTQAVSQFDQEARNFRAQTEEFEFTLLESGRWICETAAGNGYLVTADGCTCPDHEYRAADAGGFCKHRVALSRRLFLHEGRDLHREAQALRQREFAAKLAAEREILRATWKAEDDAAFARIFG